MENGYLKVHHEVLPLVLGPERRTPHEADVACRATIPSQAGGSPDWEQDFEFQDCPSCGDPMTYVGQVDVMEIVGSCEGHFYAFVFVSSRLAAVNYQQK